MWSVYYTIHGEGETGYGYVATWPIKTIWHYIDQTCGVYFIGFDNVSYWIDCIDSDDAVQQTVGIVV